MARHVIPGVELLLGRFDEWNPGMRDCVLDLFVDAGNFEVFFNHPFLAVN